MEYKGKELQFLKNINEEAETATMLLFGEISNFNERKEAVVNGHVFAANLYFLSEVFKNIRIDINSIGGSISQGNSIINAINGARMNGASITTNIVGVADSMAGMIAAFGDRGKRFAANFSSGVVHLPMAEDEKTGKMIKIDEMPEGELKNEALAMRDMLVTLMATSTGKSESVVKKQMEKGERLNAQSLKDFGMIDKIVKLSNNPIETKNKTAVELMVACSNINISKTKTMKLVNKRLGLIDEASESSVIAEIEKLENKASKADQLQKDLDAKTKEAETLQNKVEGLQAEKQKIEDEAAENYIDQLVNSGKAKADKKESLVEQYKKDPEGFKNIMESFSVDNTFVDVTTEIKGENGQPISQKEKMATEYAELYKNNPAELKNLEKKNPVKFQKMEDAYINSDIDIYSDK